MWELTEHLIVKTGMVDTALLDEALKRQLTQPREAIEIAVPHSTTVPFPSFLPRSCATNWTAD